MVNKYMVFWVALCASLFATTASAIEGLRPTVTFSLASHHIGIDQQLNERNPGISLGFILPVYKDRVEIAAQAGLYKNSFGGWSRQVSGEISTQIWKPQPDLALRVGASVGFADYGPHAQNFRAAGVPVTGNNVLFGGPTLTLRYQDRVDFKTRFIPLSTDGQAVMTFEIGFLF